MYFLFYLSFFLRKTVNHFTVLRIIKLNLFPVSVRLHSGSGKVKFHCYITIICDI